MDFLHELIEINRDYIEHKKGKQLSNEDVQKIQIKLTRKYLIDEYKNIIARFENKNYDLHSI